MGTMLILEPKYTHQMVYLKSSIIVAGVLQGDILSPYLFIIVQDYALRKAINGHEEELGFSSVPSRSRRLHPTVLTDLDFADDIALLSNTVSQARELLLRVESECKKVGLHLNTKHTKVMAFNNSLNLNQYS